MNASRTNYTKLNKHNTEAKPDTKSEVTEKDWKECDKKKVDVTKEPPVPPHLEVFKWD
jgi:hypothetical protein